MEEENTKKINFFNRLKIAIFKLEDYGFFLGERFSVAFKFFCCLILILALVVSVVDIIDFSEMLNKGISYIKNELPEFSYEDGILNFESEVYAYDEEYEFTLIINTDEEVSEEKLEEYESDIESQGLVFLKDKVMYFPSVEEISYTYSDYEETLNLDTITNKSDLVESINQNIITTIGVSYFANSFVGNYIVYFINTLLTTIVVALFGMITARICGLRFKITPIFALAIYASTLSIVLTSVYAIVYAITGFVINYFSLMTLLISYVYMIAAILMIKYDLIKQHQEIEKVVKVQKEVHDELEKEKEDKEKEPEDVDKKEKERKKKEKNEKDEGEKPEINSREPDGSEI